LFTIWDFLTISRWRNDSENIDFSPPHSRLVISTAGTCQIAPFLIDSCPVPDKDIAENCLRKIA
jgi:hypothetical protein